MSKCLYCEGPVETNQRTGQPKKYCSKKCAQKIYHKRTYKKKHADWGSKGKKAKEEQAKRREVYQWYCENWLTTKQVAELVGATSPSTVHSRAKANNVKNKVVSPGTTNGSPTAFWNPEDLEKLKQLKNDDIPEGWVSAEEVASVLGIAKSTFLAYDRKDLDGKLLIQNGSYKLFYKKEAAKIWWKKFQENRAIQVEKNKQRRKEESKRRRQEKQKKIQEKKKAKEERLLLEREQMSKLGLVDLDAVAKKCGWSSDAKTNAYRHVDSGRWSKPVKSGGTLWFKPDEIEEYYEWQNREKKPQFIKRALKHTSADAYEKRLFERKFPFWLKNNPEKKDSILINKRYKKNHEIGLTKKLKCGKCLQDLPYFDFTYGNSLRGRGTICRSCAKKINASKQYNPNVAKQQRANNHVQRFRSLIAGQIKRDMSLVIGEYQDLMVEEIWQHIETTLGYNAKIFCEHLESLFTPQMNWKNHSKDTKGFRWEVDHIVPRCELKYDSLDHPNFKKCWQLSNLRPLEHSLNKQRHCKK